MADHGVQLHLPRAPLALDEKVIAAQPDLLRAFVTSADLGGFDDKQAAAAAGMDPATWSRFKQGDVGIKPRNLVAFNEQCGNDLPLAAWAYQRGYLLTVRESEMERRLRQERERADDLERQCALLKNLLVGKAA